MCVVSTYTRERACATIHAIPCAWKDILKTYGFISKYQKYKHKKFSLSLKNVELKYRTAMILALYDARRFRRWYPSKHP